MTTITLHDDVLSVTFTTGEKIAGLIGDQRVPMTAVRCAEVVPDGLAAARGLRAPGLGLPGVRKIGTWRRPSGTSLVAVRAVVSRARRRRTRDGPRL